MSFEFFFQTAHWMIKDILKVRDKLHGINDRSCNVKMIVMASLQQEIRRLGSCQRWCYKSCPTSCLANPRCARRRSDKSRPLLDPLRPLPPRKARCLDQGGRAFNIKVVFRAIPGRMSADVSWEGFRRYREQIGSGLVQLAEYL